MVQIPKDSIRNRIIDAAETVFARVGFKQATMGRIAREAGVATGTIYTYFPGKTDLFMAIVPTDLGDEFLLLTRNRIAAFARPGGMDPDQPVMAGESGELLTFLARNRLKVIILLDRAAGSPHEAFARNHIEAMVVQTLDQARASLPEQAITELFEFMVRKILEDGMRGVVRTLEHFRDEASIGQALTAGSVYHLAGIDAFTRWATSTTNGQ